MAEDWMNGYIPLGGIGKPERNRDDNSPGSNAETRIDGDDEARKRRPVDERGPQSNPKNS